MLIQDLKWFNMFQEFRIYFGFKIENLYLATGSNFFEIDPGSNTPLWTLLSLRSYSILVALNVLKTPSLKTPSILRVHLLRKFIVYMEKLPPLKKIVGTMHFPSKFAAKSFPNKMINKIKI